MTLLFMLFLVRLFGGVVQEETSFFIPLLIILVVCMLLFYLFFPKTCHYFRCLIISSSGSRRSVAALKLLSALEGVYTGFRDVVRGRPFVIAILSLGIWCTEVGAMIYFLKASTNMQDSIRILSRIYGDILIGKMPTLKASIYLSFTWFVLSMATCIPILLYVPRRIQSFLSSDFTLLKEKRYILSPIKYYYRN